MNGVATSDTRDLPRWRQRSWLIRVTLVAAALAGLLITRRLFWGHPLLAPLPVVDLPPLPGWLARAWWGALVALLLPSLVRRRADRWLTAFCVLFFARTLWDRATWQPYFFQYGFGLLACALYERDPDGRRTTSFALAMELAGKVPFDRLVSATYPLSRYREALGHAAEAGRRGGVKIAFDLRDERRRGLPSADS